MDLDLFEWSFDVLGAGVFLGIEGLLAVKTSAQPRTARTLRLRLFVAFAPRLSPTPSRESLFLRTIVRTRFQFVGLTLETVEVKNFLSVFSHQGLVSTPIKTVLGPTQGAVVGLILPITSRKSDPKQLLTRISIFQVYY